jgi:hypothetical protein
MDRVRKLNISTEWCMKGYLQFRNFVIAIEIPHDDDSSRADGAIKHGSGVPFASFSLTDVYISMFLGLLLLLSALRKPQYRYSFLSGFRLGFLLTQLGPKII